MNRIRQTLDELGITEEPEATLTRSDAFFALVGDLLVYSDQRGVRRMSLRAMTRIRSDERGVLKIETPAGVGLSVSLHGFDPAKVQPFFLRVRDATAYAKAQAAHELTTSKPPQPKPQTTPEYTTPEYVEPAQNKTMPSKVRAIRKGQPLQAAEADTRLTVRPADLPSQAEANAPYEKAAYKNAAYEETAPAYAEPPYADSDSDENSDENETWDDPTQAPQQSRQSAANAANTSGSSAGNKAGSAGWKVSTGWKKPQQRLQRWPKVLRITAGVLAFFAVVLALYYLLAGAVASALWLLVAGLSGSVFILAGADALAVWTNGLDTNALDDGQ